MKVKENTIRQVEALFYSGVKPSSIAKQVNLPESVVRQLIKNKFKN